MIRQSPVANGLVLATAALQLTFLCQSVWALNNLVPQGLEDIREGYTVRNIWESSPGVSKAEHIKGAGAFLPLKSVLVRTGHAFKSPEYNKAAWSLFQDRVLWYEESAQLYSQMIQERRDQNWDPNAAENGDENEGLVPPSLRLESDASGLPHSSTAVLGGPTPPAVPAPATTHLPPPLPAPTPPHKPHPPPHRPPPGRNATSSPLPSTPAALVPMKGLASQTGSYFIPISLGNPHQELEVQFDTGSSFLWVNCDCISCPTNSSIVTINYFKPKLSSTSSDFPCSSTTCQNIYNENPGNIVPPASCTQSTEPCQFDITYGDRSSTNGRVLKDAISFPPLYGDVQITGSVLFGCGQNQSGNLLDDTNSLDGLIGMGVTNDSVLGQLSQQGILPFVFSFCLDSANFQGSHAILGNSPVPTTLTRIPFTINFPPPGPTIPYVYVDLLEMRVGTVGVGSSRSMSAINQTDLTGGVILDSGTTYTLVPTAVFQETLFKLEQKTGYRFRDEGHSLTCIPKNNLDLSTFPNLVMVFKNKEGRTVSWVVSPSTYMFNAFLSHDLYNIYCIGMSDLSDQQVNAIIGESFLADHFVQIDVEKRLVGFAPLNCSTGDYFTYLGSAGVTSLPPAPQSQPPPASSRRRFSSPALLFYLVGLLLLTLTVPL